MSANSDPGDILYSAGERRSQPRRRRDADLRRFHTLLATIPSVAVQGYNPDGIVHFWNAGSEALYGYSSEEALGRDLCELIIPKEMQGMVREAIAGMVQTRILQPAGEIVLRHKDGSGIPVLSSHVIIEVDGGGVELFSIDANLTEHHRNRAEIVKSEARYRALFESMPQGAFRIDREGRFIDVNPAALRMFRVGREEFLARPGDDPAWEVYSEEGSVLPHHLRPSTIALETGDPVRSTLLGAKVGAPSETIWYEATAIPEFEDDPERADHALVIMHEMTGRIRSRRRITALLREKEDLLRELHHRVRNNLAVVRSMLSLHASSVADPVAAAALADASSRITSVQVLYDRLLAHGTGPEIALGAYLPSLVTEIADVYPNRGYVAVTTTTDEVVIDAHTASLLGIVTNELVTNAMKYAYDGRDHGTLRVELRQNAGRITLLVQDDGPGPGATAAQKPDSTQGGFGLTLINSIAEQLGGEYRVEYDGGSRCIFEFAAP